MLDLLTIQSHLKTHIAAAGGGRLAAATVLGVSLRYDG